ncbi:Abi family protein [Plebeiibacterium marinum]|uniref:Abi family protein n=1 Tax=Plebeiibacterium marinum TaxID=2992111 RepID=A0AAE3MGL5_9BACT|nr:Abi family protein [Plebeiobacterium marinum]MCW3807231.1 Abi family protein [Plebeiobacterium marinum]
MDRKAIERIISIERLEPYLKHHSNDFDKAVEHYKANIEISEAFYPLLSILEIGLRNNFDYQLKRRFDDDNWFENPEFIKIVSRFQIDRVSEARNTILREKKEITTGKIISELSFGFWTSLLDSKFEKTLWKNLRLAFPNCPKNIRQRKTMSSKLNGVRRLRNRVFHHESITWSISALTNYQQEIIEGIDWLDRGLLEWSNELIRFDEVIGKRKGLIK